MRINSCRTDDSCGSVQLVDECIDDENSSELIYSMNIRLVIRERERESLKNVQSTAEIRSVWIIE